MRFMPFAMGIAVGVCLFAGSGQAQTSPVLRHIQLQPTGQTQQSSPQSVGGCPANRQSGGLCFGTTRFESYLAASAECASGGGRLATLGELYAFRAGPGKSESGIECSSTFDMGSATLWCVGNGGNVSGTNFNPQTDPLEKLPAEFRCVTYLKS